MFAEVIVDVPARTVDRPFHYSVPPFLIGRVAVGHRVLVPFGPRGKVEGYVLGFVEAAGVPDVKPLIDLLEAEPLLSQEAIQVSRWMSDRWMCTLVEALRCFLPPGVRVELKTQAKPKRERLCRPARPLSILSEIAGVLSGRAPTQAEVLRLVIEAGGAPVSTRLIAGRIRGAPAAARALEAKGLLQLYDAPFSRSPSAHAPVLFHQRPHLTLEQEEAVARIVAAIENSRPEVFLLHGVTGSGKTEVYLRALEAVLCRGRQALVLVPEISLTPQAWERFEGRFKGQVAVFHSGLSLGERFDEWWRVRRGEARVVIGARSAVFAPVSDLGLVVVDEEHETSYKQDDVSPRYHAREVAQERARLSGAMVVLGTATPSLESFQNAGSGGSQLLRLTRRVDDRPLPVSTVVDMRLELRAGNRTVLSRALVRAVGERLGRGEQSILFLNRRGFASFVLCRGCGLLLTCKDCQVSLTYHESSLLLCHYCNSALRMPLRCPKCGGRYLRQFGCGTQRVEEEVRRRFPGARLARMDADSTTRKGSHERILSAFKSSEVDVLIGTQMVAKGLDFPGVTLVGVIAADIGLGLPDFRAAERTFQLLAQVAGRAGRGEKPGEVVVQTYRPEHYAILAGSRHDYDGFWSHEIRFRERGGYPPFSSVVRMIVSSESPELAEAVCRSVYRTAGEIVRGMGEDGPTFRILGPAPAPIPKIRGRHRWHLLFLGAPKEARDLAAYALRLAGGAARGRGVSVVVDPDPLSLL